MNRLSSYVCDVYVFGDTEGGDVARLRDELEALERLSDTESSTRSGRRIRRSSAVPSQADAFYRDMDQLETAAAHHARTQLRRLWTAWRATVPRRECRRSAAAQPLRPGLTGLRNLGQTCFLNVVLQTLLHSALLRPCLASLGELGLLDPHTTAASIAHIRAAGSARVRPRIERQTTVQCRDSLETPVGGTPGSRRAPAPGSDRAEGSLAGPMLCHRLESLLRVTWSGKWSVVTPHALLAAVWVLVPRFRGFQQQDAQELLGVVTDRIAAELAELGAALAPATLPAVLALQRTLAGQTTTTVTCQHCGAESSRVEAFADLSLDLPPGACSTVRTEACHRRADCSDQVTLRDVLALFVRAEELDGAVYHCDRCSSTPTGLQYRRASRQTTITRLPSLLRVHLKRFRWLGVRREKIDTHVSFALELDMRPVSAPGAAAGLGPADCDDRFVFDLEGSVVHHGRGINSGHYTSCNRRPGTGDWARFSDAKVAPCDVRDVLAEHAYILTYASRAAARAVAELPSTSAFHAKRSRLA